MTRHTYEQTTINSRVELIDTLHLDENDSLDALMVHLQSSLPMELLMSESYGQTDYASAY